MTKDASFNYLRMAVFMTFTAKTCFEEKDIKTPKRSAKKLINTKQKLCVESIVENLHSEASIKTEVYIIILKTRHTRLRHVKMA